MLASFSRHSVQWLGLHVEHALSSYADEEAFSVHLNLSSLVRTPDLTWSCVKELCGRSVGPVYRGLKGVMEDDIEHVSRLLSELDPLAEEAEVKVEGPPILDAVSSPSVEPVVASGTFSSPDIKYPERVQRKRRRSSVFLGPIVIRPSDPSAPRIIITPCLSQPLETSCWVPYQDASFGARLTVPMHTLLNSVHPPMVAPIPTTVAQIDNWEYTDGHWRATIPTLGEQCKRGIFSRAVIPRRRFRRVCSRTNGLYP
ncbi:hypothetical protein BS17DRAFT_778529 [Gyrodon lividus]|nr:hypothetical protein BS17DRAFT_778529 [Gyrodon lividus]